VEYILIFPPSAAAWTTMEDVTGVLSVVASRVALAPGFRDDKAKPTALLAPNILLRGAISL
jgi:hypothetical protein